MYKRTSFSGECPSPLWEEFKEVPPGNQRVPDKQVCAIAAYVAIFRYGQLADDERVIVDEILSTEAPSPRSNPGETVAEVVFDELRDRGASL